MWINALGFVPSKNARVCGKHFTSGKALPRACTNVCRTDVQDGIFSYVNHQRMKTMLTMFRLCFGEAKLNPPREHMYRSSVTKGCVCVVRHWVKRVMEALSMVKFIWIMLMV